MRKRAVLSVSNKEGILELAKALYAKGYELVSTGGTAELLSGNGLPVTPAENVTGFPECLDGRVKTLHPRIFAGLLAIHGNESHKEQLKRFDITPVDVAAVNLYPFFETVKKPGSTLEEAIENIDIGGPSIIRAAAKNYNSVSILTEPSQYGEFIEKLETEGIDKDYRFSLAVTAFNHTAAYDKHIADYLNIAMVTVENGSGFGADLKRNHYTSGETHAAESKEPFKDFENPFPEKIYISLKKHSVLRYGENPSQKAAFYIKPGAEQYGIESAELLHGKELSFNNISDAQSAVALIKEFGEPACAAVKHASPCGAGTGDTISEAYKKAYECDPQSIFGGIVSFNREVDEDTAKMMNEILLDVIIAPSYSGSALRILKKKKNRRILALPEISQKSAFSYEFKSVGGGMLVQGADISDIAGETHTWVTKAKPTAEQTRDLIFAMKVARHVKSNAIVIAKEGCTLGIGGGQVSRIWAAEGAIAHALTGLKGAVLASDAMIPFPDIAEACAKAGIAAIIQPGGSVNDRLSIEACDMYGISMVFTGERHFKH